MPATPTLPIRHLTLHKHGVAWVRREGALDGERLELAFRPDEIDDALKSLAVFDHAGGRVVCVDYEPPEVEASHPPGLALGDGSGLLDLLQGLRGWPARIGFADGAQALEGRVAGLQFARSKPRVEEATLLLADAAGTVHTVPVALVAQVTPLHERSGQDLARRLDARQRAEGARAVSVRLTPGEHRLSVSYLLPSPAWRVAYRAWAQSDDGGGDTGTLLLQGWGVVDNRLDEDLVDVSIALVAGQPISFVYELASSGIPERPRIGDQSHRAARPHADAFAEDLAMSCDVVMETAEPTPVWRFARGAHGPSLDELERQHRSAGVADQGESFGYEVSDPVTIPRGASALVPILQARLAWRRELVFDEARHPSHPVAALRLDNDSGLVLERGPLTVVEDGSYRGEAVLPFTGKGAELRLPYAVELGVTVRVRSGSARRLAGVSLAQSLLVEQAWEETTLVHEIDNRSDTPRTVTVERPEASLPGELSEGPAPDERVDGRLRWRVECPPRATTALTVSARRLVQQGHRAADVDHALLARLLMDAPLDPAQNAVLADAARAWEAIEANEKRIAKLDTEHARRSQRQEQLRRNVEALKDTGPEAATRLGMVRELQRLEDRLAAIEEEREAIDAASARARSDAMERMRGLVASA